MPPPALHPHRTEDLQDQIETTYRALVNVEHTCIIENARLLNDPDTRPSMQQWADLTATHQNLLKLHEDFFSLSLNASASQIQRSLARWYQTPRRVCVHAVSALLENLNRRLPDSKLSMAEFAHTAYDTMTRFLERVSLFKDFWTCCLADIARYGMAASLNAMQHQLWSDAAHRWCAPEIQGAPGSGELYNKLGLIELTPVRRFCLHAKALVCLQPFPAAHNSIRELCTEFLREEEARSSEPASRALSDEELNTSQFVLLQQQIARFCAQLHCRNLQIVRMTMEPVLDSMWHNPSAIGLDAAHLAYYNIALLLGLGSPRNKLWRLYGGAMNQASGDSQLEGGVRPLAGGKDAEFFSRCFNAMIQVTQDDAETGGRLQFAHVVLVWMHGLCEFQERFDVEKYLGSLLLSPTGLVRFLNQLRTSWDVPDWLVAFADQGRFPALPEARCPLDEDYLMRGSLWCQSYFCHGWFDGYSESLFSTFNTPAVLQARVMRIFWLSIVLASKTNFFDYNQDTKEFSVPIIPE